MLYAETIIAQKKQPFITKSCTKGAKAHFYTLILYHHITDLSITVCVICANGVISRSVLRKNINLLYEYPFITPFSDTLFGDHSRRLRTDLFICAEPLGKKLPLSFCSDLGYCPDLRTVTPIRPVC